MPSLAKRTLIDYLPGATALGCVLPFVANVKGDAQLLFHVPFKTLTLGETARDSFSDSSFDPSGTATSLNTFDL
jgi:hypothetical protein